MIKKEKIQQWMKMLLMILISFQPILDLIWFNDGTIGELFGFTIPTLIRMSFVAALLLLVLSINRFGKKQLWILAYIGTITIYFIFHHLNCLNFHSLVPGDFNYSIFGEMFYIVRMLIPYVIVFCVYHADNFKELYFKSVIINSLIISLVVVITNIFKVSLGSYSNGLITQNVFDWFTGEGIAYTLSASRGWFFMSIVSTSLVLNLPVIDYLYLKKQKLRYLCLSFIVSLALFMFGTKATSFSVIIIHVFMLIGQEFYLWYKKKKDVSIFIRFGLLFTTVVFIFIYQFSPCNSRMDVNVQYSAKKDQEEEQANLETDTNQEKMDYISKHINELSINPTFLEKSYPFQYDPEFWIQYIDEKAPSIRMQNRITQEAILSRVVEINANKYDKLLGIGYSRTSNIYNLERDFIYQYYSMGLIGDILLLGPYIAVVVFSIVKVLKSFKEKFNLLNYALILSIGLTLCIAYYSGNILETLGITIVLGAHIGILLKELFSKNSECC